MKVSQSGIARAATRVLPATVLGVAALTGLGGSLQAVPLDTTTQSTQDTATPPPVEVADSAIEAPASLTDVTLKGASLSARLKVVSAVSTRAIPGPALAAYQRAASVINASDPSCRIDWELIAAIARVESDHGQHDGSTLDAQGVARPAIIGVALDGHGTARITDTDAGQYDDDTVHDRAVGPLQFIPETWSVVGVDADGDGVRNPQDIDDAALAAAVYLCSGSDDLSTASGRSSAVFRYNHSDAYVSVVLGLMNSYVEGNFAATPTATRVSASTTVDTRLVGTTPSTRTTKAATPRPQAPTWAVLERDRAPLRGDGAMAGDLADGTFTATDPKTPGEPAEPTSPADPTETDGSEDPPPTGPGDPTTGPDDPGQADGPGQADDPGKVDDPGQADDPTETDDPPTCAVDEQTDPATGGSETDDSETGESASDGATALPGTETGESATDPEELPQDNPCTPDIDESDPTDELPTQTPGDEAARPVS